MATASHQVHGMGTEPVAPTWAPITVDEAAAVLARFPDAGRMRALRWHSPRPFSAATLVEAQGGTFLLKRHDARVRSAEGLAEEHGFIAHLRAAGISVPEVIHTDDGASVVATDTGTYELHRQSRGADLYRDRHSWTPFLSHTHAHAAGVALARLHDAAEGYDAPARRAQPLVTSLTILPAADPLAAADAYVAARPALAAYVADRPWRAELSRVFATFGTGLADRLAAQPLLWTHNDWHPSNLLWTNTGKVATVFDFGLADRTCALHDLATAIERTAFQWLHPDWQATDFADASAAQALIAGYATIRALGRDDRETIAALLPLVHVEFALSEVDYFAGVVAAPADAALAWDGYLVAHADRFGSPAGRAFLHSLRAR
jgi:Ser/Thr protein kinase RdoA (MazF antagonist)